MPHEAGLGRIHDALDLHVAPLGARSRLLLAGRTHLWLADIGAGWIAIGAAAVESLLPLETLIERAGELIDALALLPLDRALLDAAGALSEPALRTLDAIHVTAAIDLSPIDAFVSYDERQSAAARLAGLRTVQPA